VGGADDDGTDRPVVGQLDRGAAQRVGHRGGHRVHRLGAVKDELGDVPALPVPLDADQG
jgi:hypothetical protein